MMKIRGTKTIPRSFKPLLINETTNIRGPCCFRFPTAFFLLLGKNESFFSHVCYRLSSFLPYKVLISIHFKVLINVLVHKRKKGRWAALDSFLPLNGRWVKRRTTKAVMTLQERSGSVDGLAFVIMWWTNGLFFMFSFTALFVLFFLPYTTEVSSLSSLFSEYANFTDDS